MGRPVTDAEDAWSAAEELGRPVVVKPLDGNHGRGVATNLTTREQVLSPPMQLPRKKARALLSSNTFRATTIACWSIGYQLVAAARREPAQVDRRWHIDGSRTR